MGNDNNMVKSSADITVRLAADGKNWKDWIKQLTNYSAAHNAFRVLDGSACPEYDSSEYNVISLHKPIHRDGETAREAAIALSEAAALNQHVRDHNTEVRALKAEREAEYNNWIRSDAQLQNTIMSSIAPHLIPHVRVCSTAHDMYTTLKDLNTSTDYANASVAWTTFVGLRADTCKSVREYISRFREVLGDLSSNGITIGWKQLNSVDKTLAADEIMIMHFLNGLNIVLPDWVEARNNDLRKGDKWTIDSLVPSLEDHIRRAAEEPVKAFLTVTKQKEEQRVLTRRNHQQPAQTTTVKPADPSRNRPPKPVGMCDHCKFEHTNPNDGCWKAHPELMPDHIKKKRAASKAARTNITSTNNDSQDRDSTQSTRLFSSHNYSTIAVLISPSVVTKAVHDASYKQRFCYDTAANRHVFNDRSKFVSLVRSTDHSVHGSTGSTASQGIGTVKLLVVKSDGETETLQLQNVLYCPDFATNVISQAPFKRKGAWYHSGKNKLYTPTDDELAYLPEIDGIPNFLVVDEPNEAPAALCYAIHHAYRSSADEPTVTRPADDWHHIYGHANMDILKRTAKAVMGMVISTTKLSDCPPCGLSKSKHLISRKPQDVPTTILGMVHVDIVGPIATAGRDNERYWMLLTSGKTGQQWIYTAENRAMLGVQLINWCKRMKALGLQVITIRVDNARELLNSRTRAYFTDEGIAVEASPPYDPTRNGRAERANGITENRVRAALIAAGMPPSFWPMAAHYIVRLRNLSVTSAPDGDITPLEAWNRALNYPNPIPNVAKMHAFGHTGYVYIPAQKRVQGDKFAPRAERGHLVGMIGESIYMMWIPETDKIITTASIKFDKYGAVQSTLDPSTPLSEPLIGRLQPLINRITEAPQPAPGGEDEDPVLPEVGHDGDNFDGFVDDDPVEVAPTRGNNVAPRRHEIHADLDQANIMEGPRNRRARAHFTTPTFSYCFAMAIIRPTTRLADMQPEPRNYKQFIKHPRRNDLQLAMDDEYTALIANNTWRPATPEEIAKHEVIPAQWVWAYKGDAEGNHIKDKARMVACGNRQKESIWYHEVYSYVVRTTTLRILLALVAYYDLECEQIDMITAYLNAHLSNDDVVLLRLPPGCPGSKHIVRLQRGMYGLKQSALLWYNDLKASLQELGFEPIEADPCVFVNSVTFSLIVVYVDDLILITKTTKDMLNIKNKLFKRYKARDLGPISFYLGIRVRRDRAKGTISLSMDNYIERIVKEYHMSDSPMADTPLPPTVLNQTRREGQADDNLVHQYQSLVAKLLYPTSIIRPDLSWHVNFMARFASNPSDEQLSLLKRILRYYKGSANLSIKYTRRPDIDEVGLVGYSDSAFGDNLDRKSSAGYVFKMAGGVISYKSYRQRLVTLSSTEAEYIALTYAAKEAAWLRRLLRQVGYDGKDVLPLQLYTDNLSALNMIRKDGLHERTKHIDNYYKYTKHEHHSGNVKLDHIAGTEMPADGLTKPLDKVMHAKFVMLLNMVKVSSA